MRYVEGGEEPQNPKILLTDLIMSEKKRPNVDLLNPGFELFELLSGAQPVVRTITSNNIPCFCSITKVLYNDQGMLVIRFPPCITSQGRVAHVRGDLNY